LRSPVLWLLVRTILLWLEVGRVGYGETAIVAVGSPRATATPTAS
jgi:hypothetical protein